MAFRSFLVRPFAKSIARSIARWSAKALECQEKTMQQIVSKAANTAFGRDHDFSKISTYEDFKEAIPIRDYEDLKPYIERVKSGERDVLWPGLPAYFAKTSGTTSGVKYIPMSKESTPLHFGTARNAAFNYFAQTGNGQWLDGKMIFYETPDIANNPHFAANALVLILVTFAFPGF